MTSEERDGGAFADWTVRLECGHRVPVPYGVAVPAMMACLVHHQGVCPATAGETDLHFGVPLPVPRGVAYR